jgi:hypothetical protein
MAIALLENDPKAYARYIPAIESFVKKTFDENRSLVNDHENRLYAACFAIAKGVGKLSPALQKLELRLMLDVAHCRTMLGDNSTDPMMTQEQFDETAKRLKLPPEWYELLILTKRDADDLLTAEHFRKLFAENRPLFDKVHRAFYWNWDGISVDDPIHPRTSKWQFTDSLKLLAIKLSNGEGREEDSVKNWAKYHPIDELKKDSLPDWTYALLYEHGIEPLDAFFTRFFKNNREQGMGEFYSRLKHFFKQRQEWASGISAVNAFIAKKHGSVEEILFALVHDPEEDDTLLAQVIRDIIAAYPEESRAFFAKAVNECKPEEILWFVGAAFAEASSSETGFPVSEALVLLNSGNKKVLNAAQELFFDHEAEIRPEIEARLPKLKKAASLAAQQLITKWNAGSN